MAARRQRKTLRHFFWDNKLHKVLRINRPANLIDAWCFDDRQSIVLLLSDYRDKAKPAVRSGKAAEIMRCSQKVLMRYVYDGHIHTPSISYALDGEFGETESDCWNKAKYNYWWGEHNLLELQDYMLTIRRGFPRKDGGPTPLQKTPTKAEIRAAFNNSPSLYVKGADGEYIPVFRQPIW